jgi:hypothetical protein
VSKCKNNKIFKKSDSARLWHMPIESQLLGKLRQEDHLSPGLQAQHMKQSKPYLKEKNLT